MTRLIPTFLLLGGMLLLSGNGLFSQEKKEDPKGRIPPGWSKLDLTADQKASIHKVSVKYKEDIDKLKAKIKELETEERQEMVKLLTADQKKKLQEITTGEKPEPKKEPKE